MYFDFGSILIFLIVSVVFIAVALFIGRVIRHSPVKTDEKMIPYECGEDPVGHSWIQFNIRFYVIALIFIIFDVEIVFLYPWAVVFRDMGIVTFIEMMIFVGILLLGLAYTWKKGDLDWVKPEVIFSPEKMKERSPGIEMKTEIAAEEKQAEPD
ncbi:MAG: NADH-quinone oxidoreductase subunit A [Fidelibacterota bacterium]